MKLYADHAACCGCGACADACPEDAIHMVPDREGFRYPKINGARCVSCGRCRQVCPLPRPAPKAQEHRYFGAQAKADELRFASSSGGVFPLLAQYVLARQGVVYGAAYNEHMTVVHQAAWNLEQLEGLKRTKYVQSCLDGVYRQIEEHLKSGRWVLFCGTPCQAQALQHFLGQPYSTLLVVDLVCYGVPSPGIWKRYVKHLQRVHGGRLTSFSFRDKRNRDNGHTCAYTIDGTEHAGPLNSDPYCQIFFRNVILRPSCHECRYCTPERDSDITIGDFWGVEKVRPDFDDGMGTSLVILHSPKAQAAWETVRDQLRWFPCEREDVLQPRLTSPTPSSERRSVFMRYGRFLPFLCLPKLASKSIFRKYLGGNRHGSA